MRVLTIASIFPNPAQPLHGLFVRRRVQAQARFAPHRVVSPIPSFPLADRLPRYAYRRRIPTHQRETDNSTKVDFPRFLSIPAVLKPFDGPFMARAVLRWLQRTGFSPDVIDAHLGYPDGDAARRVAKRLGIPFGVTLRGVDVNVVPERYPVRRRQLQRVLREADAVFAVAESLRRRALELGAPAERTLTVYNGVDAELFEPGDRSEARRKLGLPQDARIVLSVGHLCARKRFDVLIEAMAKLNTGPHDGLYLVIVGGPGAEGNVKNELEQQVARCGLNHRVMLAGAQKPGALPDWYRAADVFALGSEVEGRPNAVLEALACAVPVVAVRCWGLPELVEDGKHGLLLDRSDSAAFAQGLDKALSTSWNRKEIRNHAKRFTWESAAKEVVQRYQQLVGG